MKIKLSEALAIISAPRDVAIERALADDATIEDVARAGLLIRKVTTFWLRHADPANHQAILHAEDEHLKAMSLRLMEIDVGSDLTAATIAADVLRPRAKP
ncbi:hypothetical protein [Bradyrhizobium murdochi]|uniref:hypothetical protein n=1 Tax=Bradyrhizobium murdochi TaxID=1038859 RepID=UPI000418C7CF|nr:hypothetical protein [Bradyrhizobium murdochi]